MSVLIQGPQLRTIDLGILVTRAAANLPQTATVNIFTVTGGRVLITSLVGKVTSALGATATNLKVRSVPTVGTAGDIAANVLVTSKETGSLITLPATLGSALVVTSSYAAQPLPGLPGLLVPAGALAAVTDASDTGQVQWDLTYIPFDTGASVAFA